MEIVLSEEYLKSYTGKFSLDIIFNLSITEGRITRLSNIPNCINLITLNLSKNNLSNIDTLSNLTKLKILNISFNNITSIDSLYKLNKLTSLYCQGNQIENISFEKVFSGLSSLKKIYLKNVSGTFSNPICKSITYRNDIFTYSKSIIFIDGTKKGIDFEREVKEIVLSLKTKTDFSEKEKEINSLLSSSSKVLSEKLKVDEIFNSINYYECMSSVDKNLEKLRKDVKQLMNTAEIEGKKD